MQESTTVIYRVEFPEDDGDDVLLDFAHFEYDKAQNCAAGHEGKLYAETYRLADVELVADFSDQ